MHHAFVAALVLFASLLVPSPAAAFETKTTSSGQTIRWRPGVVVVVLGLGSGPDDVARPEAEAAAAAAAASWQDALEGSTVSLTLGDGGGSPVTESGDGVASLRWAMDQDDPGIDLGVLALTRISYRIADGDIEDADVVVNGAEFQWIVSPSGCADQYDLESTLAHEFGHLLGLGHPTDHPEATMFATGTACETLKRDLSDDDIDGLDHLYRGDLVEPDQDGSVAPAICAAGVEPGGACALLIVLAAFALLRRTRAALALAVVAGLIAPRAPAHAAELRRLELAELGGHADLAVRGVVVANRPAPGPELATDGEMKVSECFPAAVECPDTIQVRRRGGERADRGLWVDGEAELRAGDEVILYLRAGPDGSYRVVGGVQGMLRVVRRAGVIYGLRDLRGHRVRSGGAPRPGRAELVELAAVRRSVAHLVAPKAL
jgi:hypothetical protein